MKNTNGFSLVELIVTIVIMGIVSLICVVSYRGYKDRAIEAEAEAMLGELYSAQQVHYIRNKEFFDDTSEKTSDSSLGVDFKKNKYFTSFHSVD